MKLLQGKKTYIVGTCMCVFAVVGFVIGKVDSTTAFTMFFSGLAFMGIRNGVTTELQNLSTLVPDETLPAPAPLPPTV